MATHSPRPVVTQEAVLPAYRSVPASPDAPILIIGAGLAGLFLALRLAPLKCVIISPAPLGKASSSAWAQGGVAAALDPSDSPAEHAADTVAAGCGLVDPAIARLIAEEGPERVRDLIRLGVDFDRDGAGRLLLSLEAAHSAARVARVSGDLAGQAIMQALTTALPRQGHITLIEHVFATGLLQDENGCVRGAIVEDKNGQKTPLAARETVLCTGGSGGLFKVTTNPAAARGDALSMAWQAGAAIADPEFVQFHPTAMDFGVDPAPLATEALRGEGAVLINTDGQAFMTNYDARGELAPRDTVARAIHIERQSGRGALLDTREALGASIETHFPTVFAACQRAGLDPVRQAIPVAPAMHYHMGGIVSDTWGRASLTGLSVCGECASTGAHGANRLASNSLLEAIVFAARIAERLKKQTSPKPASAKGLALPELSEADLQDLRLDMSETCGVVRDGKALGALCQRLDIMHDRYGPARALICAQLISRAALARKESRGGHFRSDFPDMLSHAKRSFYHNTQTL